jgi:hypothetical protein
MILRGGPLTPADYAKLQARWIDRETADRNLLRRVDSREGAEIVGRNGSGDYSGIAIPYVLPAQDYVREYRLRRDNPEIEFDAEGRPKERGKYLSPPARGNMIYLPIGVDPLWLTDASIDAVITEGEFKTVALFRAAWHNLGDTADHPQFLPLGLSGVWNWKGTTAKAVNASGKRVDVRGVISDFARLKWKGRRVVIIFDRDAESNDKVKWARDLLAKELQRRGARVHVFEWPDVQEKGVDDLLATLGPDAVLELIEHAPVHGSGTHTNFVRPVVMTVNDLLELAAPERQMLIETIVPRPGAVMLLGSHKSGKTVFAVQTAIAEASGHALMDNYRVPDNRDHRPRRAPGGAGQLYGSAPTSSGRRRHRQGRERGNRPSRRPGQAHQLDDSDSAPHLQGQLRDGLERSGRRHLLPQCRSRSADPHLTIQGSTRHCPRTDHSGSRPPPGRV